MIYAISNNGRSFRAIDAESDLLEGETATDIEPAPSPMAPVITPESFLVSQGFGIFELLDLKDMADLITAANVPLPARATAVRAWINSLRLVFASGQIPSAAPYTHAEVQAEVLAVLNS